jgi:hypothetical protein
VYVRRVKGKRGAVRAVLSIGLFLAPYATGSRTASIGRGRDALTAPSRQLALAPNPDSPPLSAVPAQHRSRAAAAQCGPWREPWDKCARRKWSPGRGHRNNQPLYGILSSADAASSVRNCGFPTAAAVGHILPALTGLRWRRNSVVPKPTGRKLERNITHPTAFRLPVVECWTGFEQGRSRKKQGGMGGILRCSIRITILSFLYLHVVPLASPQQRPEPPPASTGPARAAIVRIVLDRTLKIPVQPVRGLAFGGEPPTLAAWGDDGNVRVWNAATGDPLKTIALADHPKWVSCMAFSPGGKWIVMGEGFTRAKVYTGRIELLDAVAGREVRALATHHWEVESVAISRDGRWLASSNWDRKVRLMEFPSGNQVREFESASKPRCVAISPDSKVIASGGSDFTVSLWDRERGKDLRRLTGHSGSILSVAFSPDGQRLASASADGSARIWNVVAGRSLCTLSGHVGAVMAAVFSPDGEFVVSGGADKTVRFWDATTGQNLETLGAHSSVWGVAFSSDGNYLAAGYADGTINIWKKQE